MAFLKDAGVQVRQGSYYTPLDVVENLLLLSLLPRLDQMSLPEDLPHVLDPSCGTGNFLIVSALMMSEQLIELGMGGDAAIDFAVRHGIFGVDIDGEAVKQCRESLSLMTDGRVSIAELHRNVVHADSLRIAHPDYLGSDQLDLFLEADPNWFELFPETFSRELPGFDLVVGNPPFLNQLETETTLEEEVATSLHAAFGSTITRLTNPASVFLLLACHLVSERGSVVMMQPLSFLSTTHSADVRNSISSRCRVSNIWICLEHIFEAAVEVVAIYLDRGQDDYQTQIHVGREFRHVGEVSVITSDWDSWSAAIALALGHPTVELDQTRPIGEIASASAAFRDQYYGLVGAVAEFETGRTSSMQLATVGLIDPAVCRWSKVPTRFAKTSFRAPVVLLDALQADTRRWADSLAGPKILVATQSRIIECVVDSDGSFLPSVPLVTVRCPEEDIWKVAAALSAPPVSLLAARRHLGTGLSGEALRIRAKDLLRLPLPISEPEWLEGAGLLQEAHLASTDAERTRRLVKMGKAMCAAYGVDNLHVLDWWISRLPVPNDAVSH